MAYSTANQRALLIAIKGGDLANVQFLLQAEGVELNPKNVNWREIPLCLASSLGHYAIVCALVEHGADVNLVDEFGSTSIMDAADCNWASVAQLLLDLGARTNAQLSDGFTALHFAAKKGNTYIIRLLLDYGASRTIVNKNKLTAESVASLSNQTEAALLIRNYVPRLPYEAGNRWVLLSAVKRGGIAEVRRLLDVGNVDLNPPNVNWREIPLCIAAIEGHLDIASLLIDRGADVNHPDENNSMALMDAADNDRAALVNLLLDRGAQIDAQLSNGYTALHFAARKGLTSIVRLLLDRGANRAIRTNDGHTAEDVALAVWKWETAAVVRDHVVQGNAGPPLAGAGIAPQPSLASPASAP